MNKYILCYRSEQGNRPCKNYHGEYITGIDKEDVDIKSTEYWEYYMEWQGFFGQILCRVIISVLYWC